MLNRWGKKAAVLCSTLAVSTGLMTGAVGIPAASATETISTDRLAGDTRYETAVEASRATYPAGARTVYLATGRNFADALVAAPAAALVDAPLLLTRPDRLDATVAEELRRLAPEEVVIVGGTAAVSNTVQSEAADLVDEVTRLAGDTRYETANAIVQASFGPSDHVYLATGSTYADALSASVVAASQDAPVLLVKGTGTTVPDSTLETFDSLGVENVVVAGGSAAVSQDIVGFLQREGLSTERAYGETRYETNLALNDRIETASDQALLATGSDYPDALTAAAIAGAQEARLYLSKPTCLPNLVHTHLHDSAVGHLTLIGGHAALSANVEALVLCDRAGINDDLPKSTASVLTQLESLDVKGRAPKTGYDRDEFGPAWYDVDGNGCRTRDDILRRDLYNITLGDTTQCPDKGVRAGTLDDPYTGETIDFVYGVGTSNAVHIDHVVALSDSWQKGAQQMSYTHRLHFANDPLNLLAVDGPANSAKGDSDAATWLPPNKPIRCDYVTRQTAIKAKYDLWVTAAERDAIKSVVTTKCPDQKALAVTPVR